MKIYKSVLKKLIIECINEVLEGGPGSGQKGHKTDVTGKTGGPYSDVTNSNVADIEKNLNHLANRIKQIGPAAGGDKEYQKELRQRYKALKQELKRRKYPNADVYEELIFQNYGKQKK